MDSNCTEMPSTYSAPGTIAPLVPDSAQTPPLPAQPFLFAPLFSVLQALVLHLGANTLTHLYTPHALTPMPWAVMQSPSALTALWGHLFMTH